MNKVILMGRLTRDPEVRYSQGERPVAVARYTLAVNRTFKRAGEPDADFINCVTFGRSAEFAEKYFRPYRRVRKNPDRQLHKSRRSKGLYDRYCCRRSGICRE